MVTGAADANLPYCTALQTIIQEIGPISSLRAVKHGFQTGASRWPFIGQQAEPGRIAPPPLDDVVGVLNSLEAEAHP